MEREREWLRAAGDQRQTRGRLKDNLRQIRRDEEAAYADGGRMRGAGEKS